jgi:probable HAF family extracellular repeat protein
MGSSFHLPRPGASRVAGLAAAASLLAGIGTGLAGGPGAQASTHTYTITNLGGLGGATDGSAINATGEVVGQSYLAQLVKVSPCPTGGDECEVNPAHAVSWTGGKITDLGTLPVPKKGQTFSMQPIAGALAVNRSGDVVGISNGNGFLFHGGQITQVGPPGFGANGINDAGNIVGYLDSHAYLISGGTTTQLPDLATRTTCCNADSQPVGINNNNEIAGDSADGNGDTHAVVWNNGTITDLGTLGGLDSFAYGINNLGQVVGVSMITNSTEGAFLYSGGKMTGLGSFGDNTHPAAINDNDVIVGSSSMGAWVWSNGVFQNLSNLIPPGSGIVLTQATAINGNGQIVAENAGGATFLLTPS